MNYFSATDAKNRFGELLEAARKEPVHVQKNGRDVAVVISPEEYARLTSGVPVVNPLIKRLHDESHARWGKVYEALAK
ncbi:MAG: type II toxin-antitoxin system Phd/YefM family antitoxin [Devosia sp.]